MLISNSTNILIVDDLSENLRALEKIIEANNRNIYQARSGDAALGLLLEHDFALAILDVMMPGMNGFELAELMRSTERTRHIPIIFVSAGGRELNYAFKGYESGAVDFLHKPLDIAAVKSKVNVFVSLHQQSSEVKRQVKALEKSQRELQSTQAELQAALKMRDDFMSLVSHELRTPLNTLHVDSQIRTKHIEKGQSDAFTLDKLAVMFERDRRQIKSMVRLIGDMVDVSRIQNGKLSISSSDINLTDLVKQVVADLNTHAEAAGTVFNLSAEENITGKWDDFRVEQIIVNLLTNALRYGGNKPVDISVTTANGFANINVRDQGPGIPQDECERIFEKFERGGNKTVKEGLGIGLYIARELAEAHRGNLTVTSKLGEGSTFTLSLPL
jgi:signal transduction histidine kinase